MRAKNRRQRMKKRINYGKHNKVDLPAVNWKQLVITAVILFFILIISTIFALITSLHTKILPRVSINNIFIGNRELNEAYQVVEQEIENRRKNNLIVKLKEFESTISLKQLEIKYDVETIVNQAYHIGRENNMIQNNYEILWTLIQGKKLNLPIELNEEELDKMIEDIADKLPGVLQQSSYYREGNELVLLPGVGGKQVQKEKLKEKIIQGIQKRIQGEELKEITIPIEEKQPDPLDLEKIRQEIYQEPKNAYYEQNPFQLYPELEGIEFEISIEEAKKLLEEEKTEYRIPLKITKPEVTIEEIGMTTFPEQLGKFNTRYDESNKNRTINIKLASEKINGKIIMPGEIFSYNKVVGERTIKSGYKEAAVYMNGKVVDGIGGGICQVSSTLYNAILDANLEVVTRRNHYFITSYVPPSRDATVSYGTIDFQFKNNRNYPIKIECTAQNGISQVIIKGIKEEKEYEVVVQNEVTEVIPYTTKYIDRKDLEKGVERVIQKGTNGYKSEAYKILQANGVIVSKTLLSKDSYHPMEEVIERGTK